MARSPFEINSSTHYLSEYMNRVGLTGDVTEVRINVAGWTSQHAICPKPKVDNPVVAADLVAYAKSRSVVAGMETQAVKPIADAINNAQPVTLVFNGNKWCLQPKFAVRNMDAVCNNVKSLFTQLSSLYYTAARREEFLTSDNGGGNSCGTPIVSWTPLPGARAGIRAKVPRISDEMLNRVTDSFNWYMAKLEQCGFRREELVYKGLVRFDYNGSRMKSVDFVKHYTKGVLTIIGPKDSNGEHPVHQCATSGTVGVVWVLPMQTSIGITNTSIKFRLFNSAVANATWVDINTELKAGGWSGRCYSANFCAGVDSSTAVAVGFGDGTPWSSVVPEGAVLHKHAVLTGVPPTAPTGLLDIAFGVDDRLISESIVNPCVYISSTHVWVLPTGCTDVVLFEGEVAATVDLSRLVRRVIITPTICGFTTTVASLRSYMVLKAEDQSLSAADRESCRKTVEALDPYIDGLVTTTVYTTAFTPPSRADVLSTFIVRKASQSGVDLLSEKINDSGATLDDFVKVTDKHRSDGRTYHAFARITDESAYTEQLVSAEVARTISVASAWKLTYPTGGDGTVLVGSFAGGAVTGLTSMEVVLLYMSGAVVPSGFDDAYVVDRLGFPTTFRSDLDDLIAGGHLLPTGTSWWGGSCTIGGLVLDPNKFLNGSGYPVIDYKDSDSRTRAMLLFKGSKSDAANMTCMMFFTNTI